MGDGAFTTFQVDKVRRATKRLEQLTLEAEVARITRRKCEAIFHTPREAVDVSDIGGRFSNRFVAAVHVAYSKHYPLILTPDAIWMCVAQGFAAHVSCNSKKLRHLFVQHEGKKVLTVRRDDFVKGSSSNPWPDVFDDFSSQIKEAVGHEIYDALSPSFTTTGPVERAAARLVIMNAFKEYFSYRVCTLCGIPEVTLEGTVGDWINLKEKAVVLGSSFDLSWWIDELRPVLDQFVEAASGRVDQKFWSSIYKLSTMSGGPYIAGWITTLFPYIKSERNPYLCLWREISTITSEDEQELLDFEGMTTDNFPPGVGSTSFLWNYCLSEHPMNFYSGFMAISQDPRTLALRPEIGWAVSNETEEDRL